MGSEYNAPVLVSCGALQMIPESNAETLKLNNRVRLKVENALNFASSVDIRVDIIPSLLYLEFDCSMAMYIVEYSYVDR